MGEWYSAGECAKKPAGARADFHLCSLFRALEQSFSLTLEKESPVAPHLYQVNPSACQCTMASRQLVGKQRQLVGKQEGPQPPQKKCASDHHNGILSHRSVGTPPQNTPASDLLLLEGSSQV
jgi:hypothetical protein